MRKTQKQIVLEAVRDLHAQEQPVLRHTLVEVTGLTLGIVDNALSELIDDMEVVRIERGVFAPMLRNPPARIISRTIIPGGWTKLEIGDDYAITLTPAEARAVGDMMAGAGQQLVSLDVGRQSAVLAADLAAKLRKLEREIKLLKSERVEQKDDLLTGLA